MHWSQTCIQIVCFIYLLLMWRCHSCTTSLVTDNNLSWVSVFCSNELWLLSGQHAWSFSAWKQTRGKVVGADVSQNPSPMYSQQGAWNCVKVSNMQLQKSFWFIQFPSSYKKSRLYFTLWLMVLALNHQLCSRTCDAFSKGVAMRLI